MVLRIEMDVERASEIIVGGRAFHVESPTVARDLVNVYAIMALTR